MRRTFKDGDYLVTCDISGQTFYASECKMTWDGKFVHKSNWEPRHPQDFVRSRVDNQTVPIARPPSEDQFISPQYMTGFLVQETWNGVQPIAYLLQEDGTEIIW